MAPVQRPALPQDGGRRHCRAGSDGPSYEDAYCWHLHQHGAHLHSVGTRSSEVRCLSHKTCSHSDPCTVSSSSSTVSMEPSRIRRSSSVRTQFNWPPHRDMLSTDSIHADVFDGMMVTLAMYALNFMHPGQLLLATRSIQSYALTGSTASN